MSSTNSNQQSERSSEQQHNQQCLSFRRPETRAMFELWSKGIPPRILIRHLAPTLNLPADSDDIMLWNMLVSMLEPPKRKKLKDYNTIEDAVELIKNSHRIMVLSGAGISTSAGLPDFRSRDGIYVQIHEEYPDLTDPKSMFEIGYFKTNPLPFYRFAKALYPGQFEPTIGHKFIKCIEDHEKLLRNYSQNIDTLEKQAGIKRVIECHGSFSKASCTNCNYCVDGDDIKDDIMNQKVPHCPKCLESKKTNNDNNNVQGDNYEFRETDNKLAIMKPNIVFFGEQLGDEFHSSLEFDKEQLDLLIVIGSSLKVRPVALIPDSVPPEVPQILINKEPLENFDFDIELLGNCDDIIQELCLRLGNGWSKICKPDTTLMTELDPEKILRPLKSGNNSGDRNDNNEQACNLDTSLDNNGDNNIDIANKHSKTIQANVTLESTEQNMIDAEIENKKNQEGKNKLQQDSNECDAAVANSDDDDWEDVEVMRSSNESLNSYTIEKAPLDIPNSSYVQVKPGKYLFHGAELTYAQYVDHTKRLFSSQNKDFQSSSSESE